MKPSLLSAAAIGTLLISTTAQTALADSLEDNRIVRDTRGNPVHAMLSSTCVHTKWENKKSINPCDKKIKHVAELEPYKPSPARSLKVADKMVTFDFDSAKLDPLAEQRLDNLANILKRSGDVRDVDIVGFADKIGNADYNIRLSKERAAAVKSYLASQGYMNTRVVDTRGLGETRSITQCESQDSHEQLIRCLRPDRRVEVEVKFMDHVKSSNYHHIKHNQ